MPPGFPEYRRPFTNTVTVPVAGPTLPVISDCRQIAKNCPRVYERSLGDSTWMIPSWAWTCSH